MKVLTLVVLMVEMWVALMVEQKVVLMVEMWALQTAESWVECLASLKVGMKVVWMVGS